MSEKIESPRIIDTALSSKQYFYCKKNEMFSLNSLEVLDQNQFIYRCLKSSGFEVIIFVDEVYNNQFRRVYQIITYDRFSYFAFRFQKRFQEALSEQEAENNPSNWLFCNSLPDNELQTSKLEKAGSIPAISNNQSLSGK